MHIQAFQAKCYLPEPKPQPFADRGRSKEAAPTQGASLVPGTSTRRPPERLSGHLAAQEETSPTDDAVTRWVVGARANTSPLLSESQQRFGALELKMRAASNGTTVEALEQIRISRLVTLCEQLPSNPLSISEEEARKQLVAADWHVWRAFEEVISGHKSADPSSGSRKAILHAVHDPINELVPGTIVHHERRGNGKVISVEQDDKGETKFLVHFDLMGDAHKYTSKSVLLKFSVVLPGRHDSFQEVDDPATQLLLGTIVRHPTRGTGKVNSVVETETGESKYVVCYAAKGDTHTYNAKSALKLVVVAVRTSPFLPEDIGALTLYGTSTGGKDESSRRRTDASSFAFQRRCR
jgi:hypothetical protein